MYDDGGLSGGTIERPALQLLLSDMKTGKVQIIVAYKVDRLTRCSWTSPKIVDVLDAHDASFVSVTQQFNTTTSIGRLTLNMLVSFAQFEREIGGERIRDKIAARGVPARRPHTFRSRRETARRRLLRFGRNRPEGHA
jgi:site-specific DNA recombinase